MPLRLTVVAVTVLSVLLSACGGDPGASETAGGAPSQAPEAAVVEEGAADEAATGDTEPTGAAPGDAGAMDLSSMSNSECLNVAGAMTTVMGRGIIGDFEADLATVRSFIAGAPGDVRDQIQIVLDAFEASHQVFVDAGVDPGSAESMSAEGAREATVAAEALIETPEVESALERWEPFLYDVCPQLAP